MEERKKQRNEKRVLDAYCQMELLPGQILSFLTEYSKEIQEELERHARTENVIRDRYISEKEKLIKETKDSYCEDKVAIHKSYAKYCLLYDQIIKQTNLSVDAEMYLKKILLTGSAAAENKIKPVLNEIVDQQAQYLDKMHEISTEMVNKLNEIFAGKTDSRKKIFRKRMLQEEENYKRNLEMEHQRTRAYRKEIDASYKKVLRSWKPVRLHEKYKTIQYHLQNSMELIRETQIPDMVGMGYLYLELDRLREIPHVEPMLSLLCEYLPFAIHRFSGKNILQFPYGRALDRQNFNKLILYDDVSRQQAEEYVEALALGLSRSLPDGMFEAVVFHPVIEKNIRSVNSWEDTYREGFLFCNNIQQMKEQLKRLLDQMEYRLQHCLKDEFTHMMEYNRQKKEKAETVYALCITNFPDHFDSEACHMLEEIVKNGSRYGIYTFLCGTEREIRDCKWSLSGMTQVMEKMICEEGQLYHQLGNRRYLLKLPELRSGQEQGNGFSESGFDITLSIKRKVFWNRLPLTVFCLQRESMCKGFRFKAYRFINVIRMQL